MRNRVALVLAALALVIAVLALSSVGGAGNARQEKPGPSGQEAYALVNSADNGGGFATQSGFSSVFLDSDGHYCLKLAGKTSFSGRVAIVAPEDEIGGGDYDAPLVTWDSTTSDCPAGTIQVNTEDGAGTDVNDLAFTILVPALS